MQEFDVSVTVLTYNPSKVKLFKTIKSILFQKDIYFEIIISDDGSEVNYFDELKELFLEWNFFHYQLINNTYNEGTVKNLIRAVESSNGEYIKPISPGDYLFSENSLVEWIEDLKNSKNEWSFGDAIYYQTSLDGNVIPVVQEAHPFVTKVYKSKNVFKARWYYTVLNDICLGAATVCKKSTMEKYLKLIDSKVVYSEDSIFRIMMIDGIIGKYYKDYVIFYEFGEGVSTNNDTKWKEILINEWNVTTGIMLSNIDKTTYFGKKALKAYKVASLYPKYLRLMRQIFEPGRVNILFKYIFFKRKTPAKIPKEKMNLLDLL